jgi:hypothetical protein
MGRYTKEPGSGNFLQPDPGSHVARYISIIDIGTQHGEYQGKPTVQNQIIIQWELPYETVKIEGVQKPMIISKFYTNSLSEKANLRRDLEAVRGKPFTSEELARFDLNKVLGAQCTLNIVQNDKGKAKGLFVGALTKGTTCPPMYNEKHAFWIEEWDDNKFHALPEGFRKLIMESDEYKAAFGPGNMSDAAEPPRKSHAEQLADIDVPF